MTDTSTHTLVVGGTRGAGRAIVRRFAADGGTVSVIGRREPPEARLPNVRLWQLDLRDLAAIVPVLREAVAVNGPLRNAVLVQRFRGDEDAWQGELDVSLTATNAIFAAIPDLFGDGGGSIVAIGSSVARFVAWEQPAAYHVAKAGLLQLVRYYAAELGPRGIRVNAVTPGAVLKEETAHLYVADRFAQNVADATALRRLGTTEDVAAAVALLCSPDAAFVTGHELVSDGGLSLQWQESLLRRYTEDAK